MGTLSGLFAPKRVAVVGATDREGSVGRAVMENLRREFDGEIVPVNPNRESVLGVRCVESIADASDADLAVVVVPPAVAVEVVDSAGAAGIENVVVITAGFGEAGSEGAGRERELRAAAERHDLNLVGPNSLGIMSSSVGLNATFGPESPEPGSLSFMSQSGAFITAVLDWAAEQDLGFKDVVSLGNKAVLDETDFIEAWADDPETDVILGYLEGIDDGRAFVDTAREVTAETPIVLVKSGRTDAGAQAASSHTGTIAGSEEAYQAGLSQAGVLRADSVQELFDAARVLAGQPLPEGDDVAVVTNAGGPGVMSTDAVGDSRLSMASFADETIDQLSELLPAEANIYNPVDVVGDAPIERFRTAIDAVLADPNVDSVVVVSCPTAVLSYDELAATTVELHEEHGKPVVASLMGGERTSESTEILQEGGIPNYFDPARAVRGLDALAEQRELTTQEYEPPTEYDVDRDRARAVLDGAIERGEPRIGVEAMELLDAYGIDTAESRVVDSPADAEAAAEELGPPVVMKIVSPDILHKSDIGGVRIGVEREGIRDAYEDLVTRARNYQPDADLLGVQVQEQLSVDDATETIVGTTRDPQFGPLVLFGLGGIFVEVLEDTEIRVAPVSDREARQMVGGIDAAPLLRGARGRTPVDEAAIAEAIGRLSQLVTDFPSILELDVNPLLATPDGVRAVDLQLTVDLEER